jgi:hypothetical protein
VIFYAKTPAGMSKIDNVRLEGGKGRRTAALACALLPLSLLLPSTTLLGPMRGEDEVLRVMRSAPPSQGQSPEF